MISNLFKQIFNLLLFSTLINPNPGVLAGNPDDIPHCHPAMFDTSSELTYGQGKYRPIMAQGTQTSCLLDSNLEFHFNPKLYAYHLYIHGDLMVPIFWLGHGNVTVELSHGSRSRQCTNPFDVNYGDAIVELASELYYLWNCGDVDLIDRLSMAIIPSQSKSRYQSGRRPKSTFLSSEKFINFEKFLSSNSSIPLVLVEVNKCLNNPPAVKGATWRYKHQGNFLWMSYQCNELGNKPGEVWNKMLECNHSKWTGEVPRCQVITSTPHTNQIIGWSIIPLVALALVAVGFACGRSWCCKRRGGSKNDGPNTNQKDNSSCPQYADSALPPRAREEQIYETLDYFTVRQAFHENNTIHNDNRRDNIQMYDYPVCPGSGHFYDDATRSDLTSSSVSLGTFSAGLTDSVYLTPI